MFKDTGLACLEPRRIRLPDTFLETPQNSYLPLSSGGMWILRFPLFVEEGSRLGVLLSQLAPGVTAHMLEDMTLSSR